MNFALEERLLKMEYHKGGFFNKVVTIKLGGKDLHALPKDLQLHPVSDRIEHADFFEVTEGSEVAVEVPVRFLKSGSLCGY